MPAEESTTEIWKPVVGYEGLYEVSTLGGVRRIASWKSGNGYRVTRKPKPRMTSVNLGGYPSVLLRNGNRYWKTCIHRLVAIAFIGPRPDGFQVNHRDGNKFNNSVSNLEYVTPRENILHAVATGHWSKLKGETQSGAKLSENSAKEILSLIGKTKQKTLASRFGVSESLISRIKHRRAWKHIPHGVISPG